MSTMQTVTMHAMDRPGARVDGARVCDVVVRMARGTAFVSGCTASGPVVMVGRPSLARFVQPGDGPVDIRRTLTGWGVVPSNQPRPTCVWPPHVDLREWVERALGPLP